MNRNLHPYAIVIFAAMGLLTVYAFLTVGQPVPKPIVIGGYEFNRALLFLLAGAVTAKYPPIGALVLYALSVVGGVL